MYGLGMVHRGWEAVAMEIIADVRREAGQVLGERPSDCPRQWAAPMPFILLVRGGRR